MKYRASVCRTVQFRNGMKFALSPGMQASANKCKSGNVGGPTIFVGLHVIDSPNEVTVMATKEFIAYQEQVLHELELLNFPEIVTIVCEIGVDEAPIAVFMHMMMRANHICGKSPSYCAREISTAFVDQLMKVLDSVIIDTIMSNTKFPSE
jgi:hypothetical protein